MPTPPPAWLQTFANDVAARIVPVDLLPPLGCHFAYVEPQWEVTLFAASTEVVGGQRDGELRPARFACNVKAVLGLFDAIETIHWQTMMVSADDELGAHISIEGLYEGRSVWLRILARPPRRFEAGRLARVNEMSWEEVW